MSSPGRQTDLVVIRSSRFIEAGAEAGHGRLPTNAAAHNCGRRSGSAGQSRAGYAAAPRARRGSGRYAAAMDAVDVHRRAGLHSTSTCSRARPGCGRRHSPRTEAARTVRASCAHEVDWQQEEILIFGQRRLVPRLVAWHGDPGRELHVLGHRAPAAAVDADPRAHSRPRRRRCAGVAFNAVLLNLYRDGRDGMGWHADDEPELGRNPVIASVSLGADAALLPAPPAPQGPEARPAAAPRQPALHERRHPAPLAARAAQDAPAGRRAHQPDVPAGRG